MSYSFSGAEKPNPLLFGEGLDLLVFLKICLALVLDVVVEGEHDLAGIVDFRSANGHKLRCNGPRVAGLVSILFEESNAGGIEVLLVCHALVR